MKKYLLTFRISLLYLGNFLKRFIKENILTWDFLVQTIIIVTGMVWMFKIGQLRGAEYGANWGYEKGYGDGIDATLDTVNAITSHQLKNNDKEVTRIGFDLKVKNKRDTIWYFLSKKSIKPAKK